MAGDQVQSLLGVMARDLRLDRGKDHTDFPQAIDDQAKRLYEARKAAAGAGTAKAPGEGGAAGSGDADPGGAVAVGSPAVPGVAVAGVATLAGATPDGATPDGAGPVVMVAAGETPAAAAVPGDPAAEWLSLQELIFKFDQHIQNVMVRHFRMMFRTLRIFWPELIGAAVAAAALSGFAVAFGQNHISSLAKSAVGFIAITGFSIAGVMAKLKSQARRHRRPRGVPGGRSPG